MDRQLAILEAAQTRGRVSVDALARELGVSAHTIRRDINTLCEQSKLRRLHGGAEFIEGLDNLPYGTRKILNVQAKQAIARKTASLIPDGAILSFSIGTTPALVAAALGNHQGLTIITNNLNVAMTASENRSNRVIIPGGELRLPDRDILGQSAREMFAAYRAEFGIYGVGGVDDDGSLLDFHEEEVQNRQAIRASARKSILVLDHSKFGRHAAAFGGHLRDADQVVIDQMPDPRYHPLLDPLGAALIVAEPEA
ncbi:DeoR/GlpR family DNA-binding transcription regulator [Pseudooceanicola aestuarii]|uniref:DeoR/GlpR family DNA-binding transcription regulator n=1 Tax=Pseudooceanicola aestuarii TaxID=2697319 RepID=UPI0013D7F9EE|nr:DeoR/GlpR family DNA-binding transcription regulator [Pseudooceanicola aestuarii]